MLFWGIYSASRKYWQCLACSTFSHVYITIFYSWHKSWKKKSAAFVISLCFFYVIRYGRKFLGIMHGLHSAAKQSTVQCSNLFVATPKRKQKMRKKSMLAMLQIEKKNLVLPAFLGTCFWHSLYGALISWQTLSSSI